MKIRRYKKVHKNINFYINNYGFRQPFQILIDGTFCFAALKNKINIADNIPRYLQGEVKLLTTPCSIIEMEQLGRKVQGALLILKKFAMHKCGHECNPVSGSKCFSSMLGKDNVNHYVIATQDRDLQNIVRGIPGAPLLYLHSKAPVLEQPSDISLQKAKLKLRLSESEIKIVEELKLKNGLLESSEMKKKRKKKGANPLSCKKKRKLPEKSDNLKIEGGIDRKRRKKIRIPKHVKEELLKLKKSSN